MIPHFHICIYYRKIRQHFAFPSNFDISCQSSYQYLKASSGPIGYRRMHRMRTKSNGSSRFNIRENGIGSYKGLL